MSTSTVVSSSAEIDNTSQSQQQFLTSFAILLLGFSLKYATKLPSVTKQFSNMFVVLLFAGFLAIGLNLIIDRVVVFDNRRGSASQHQNDNPIPSDLVDNVLGGYIVPYDLVISLVISGIVGRFFGRWPALENLPEYVVGFHTCTGIALAVLGFSSYFELLARGDINSVEVFNAVDLFLILLILFTGFFTATGCFVAARKLDGSIPGRPENVQHLRNRFKIFRGVLIVSSMVFLVVFLLSVDCSLVAVTKTSVRMALLGIVVTVTLGGCYLGYEKVMTIGGADMPIVFAMLICTSAVGIASSGFLFSSNLLVLAGGLLGSTSFVLTNAMCRGINRSVGEIMFPSGSLSSQSAATKYEPLATSTTDKFLENDGSPSTTPAIISSSELACRVLEAKRILIVPGYGAAVANSSSSRRIQASGTSPINRKTLMQELAELVEMFSKTSTTSTSPAMQGKTIHFGIHPVAGRLPAHMDILLAEVGICYGDNIRTMEEVNEQMGSYDVVIMVGANDIVNAPMALDDRYSPIYGTKYYNTCNFFFDFSTVLSIFFHIPARVRKIDSDSKT